MNNKWQEEYIACFIIFGLLIAFSVFILKQYFYPPEKALDVINAAILFWTGIVIAIYTRETYKLREVAQKQIELQQRPFVIFEIGSYESEYGDDRQYRIRNIGVGTAINVCVLDIYPESEEKCYRFVPHFFPILEPHQIKFLHPHILSKDKKRMGQTVQDINYRTFFIRVQFSNIDMTPYAVSQRFNSGSLASITADQCTSVDTPRTSEHTP
jgi:hypothetical protein